MSGAEVYKRIQANIIGRIAINEPEAVLLYDTLQQGDLYVEVGCLWGGTAVLAAMKAARVLTVDIMRGEYWERGDPGVNKECVTAEKVLENFSKFGVAHKISLIRSATYPWPMPHNIMPDVFLVDAGHSYEAALNDWNTARLLAKRAILVHDYHRARQHAGVVEMVDNHAKKDEVWEMTAHEMSMALFTRRGAE